MILGYMSEDELEWLYREARNSAKVVEIGCWKGLSIDALLKGCNGTVYAVDTWEKSYLIKNENASWAYNEFVWNVGHYENLEVLRMSSIEAAELFENKSVDMVFIDGCHEEMNVENDILTWLPKTRRVICGHDYECPNEPGVKPAVDRIFSKPDGVVNTIWFVRL